jgi:hypothetical protein
MADKKTFKAKAVDLAAAVGLYREVQSPGAWESVVLALKRGGKTAVAAGVGYGLIVLLGVLQANQDQSELLTLVFKLVSVQALVGGIAKFLREHYGVTLPF